MPSFEKIPDAEGARTNGPIENSPTLEDITLKKIQQFTQELLEYKNTLEQLLENVQKFEPNPQIFFEAQHAISEIRSYILRRKKEFRLPTDFLPHNALKHTDQQKALLKKWVEYVSIEGSSEELCRETEKYLTS